MNDDELKKLWRQQSLRAPDQTAAQVISAMQNQTTKLRHTLLVRDVLELVACVIGGVIFGIYYFMLPQTTVSRLGDLIVIGSLIFIGWKLVHTRRSNPPAPPGATVVESLRAELNSVSAQSQLLGSVLWWYLLPPAIGIFVCTWGSFGGGFSSFLGIIIYTIIVIALFAFINWLNQEARASRLLPLEAQLKSLLHSAETGEPLDERQAGNLRTIALSMAAANKIKPVEFKVAFWQLAIFGVPGIVGIWFCLMIGLTDWNIKPRILETYVLRLFSPLHMALFVPFFLGGLLYSWLIQKATERAVGISALGIHLCKGQTLILWDEIKEVRPFRFLHVRNLWLIKESGEKTRMHWTPLERHAEVKAAIKSCAPANHPVRQYLSLLK